MKRLILHIGGPKCGSSTLQSYFGARFSGKVGFRNRDGETLRYAAILQDGSIISGPQLQRQQSQSSADYVASAPLPQDPQTISERLETLSRTFGQNDTVILSSESWAAATTAEMAIAFNKLSVPVDVFCVTRAPVDWMNSSWWQWGVWTDHSLEEWIGQQMSAANFFRQIDKWKCFDGVRTVTTVDISQNIINAVDRFLNVDTDASFSEKKVNITTNIHLLRHLVNNKEKYGRTVHNPDIEFRLNRLLQLSNKRPPFVIDQRHSRHIIETLLPDSARLLAMINSDQTPLSNDVIRRYLQPDYYDSVKVVAADDAMRPEPNDAFIGELVDSVINT